MTPLPGVYGRPRWAKDSSLSSSPTNTTPLDSSVDLDVIANDKKMMTAPTTRNEHGDAEIIHDWFHYVTVVFGVVVPITHTTGASILSGP